MTERSVFLAALDIDDPAARSAYLDEACGADAALRRRLEDLLAAASASGSFMAGPAAGRLAPDPTVGFGDAAPAGEPPGTVIAGRYKLLEPIGEGGMGTVWAADQTDPVKRRVAVKLVRADRAGSKAILARFEAERQAIARMDHRTSPSSWTPGRPPPATRSSSWSWSRASP
ncbi:MAG: hypothetical protein K2X87_24160 [Gemmataceae bacterium]|nr:hypothetical protein [Gemmataceae bacterium]